MITFGQAQRLAWENKLAHGFNTTSAERDFCFAVKELGEAFDAWRLGRPDAGEELADVAIYLFGLAQMQGFDLGAEIERKLEINAARVYRTLGSGAHVREEAAGD